jgi:hypothetical protein
VVACARGECFEDCAGRSLSPEVEPARIEPRDRKMNVSVAEGRDDGTPFEVDRPVGDRPVVSAPVSHTLIPAYRQPIDPFVIGPGSHHAAGEQGGGHDAVNREARP